MKQPRSFAHPLLTGLTLTALALGLFALPMPLAQAQAGRSEMARDIESLLQRTATETYLREKANLGQILDPEQRRQLEEILRTSDSEITRNIESLLQQTASETYLREKAKLSQNIDPQQRRQLEGILRTTYLLSLWRLQKFAPSFAEHESKGPTSLMYQKMLGLLTDPRGRLEEAMTCVSNQRDSIFRNATASKDPAHTERNRFYLQPLLQLAVMHEIKGELVKAESLYREILAAQPDWPEALHQRINFLYAQGLFFCQTYPAAEAAARHAAKECLRLAQKLTLLEPSEPRWIMDLAHCHELLYNIALKSEKLAEGEANLRRMLTLAQNIQPRSIGESQLSLLLAKGHSQLGGTTYLQGKTKQAAQAWKESLGHYQKFAVLKPDGIWAKSLVANTHLVMAQMEQVTGRLDLAKLGYERTLAITRKQGKEALSSSRWQLTHIQALDGLGDVVADQGSLQESAKAYQEGLEAALRQTVAEADDPGWKSLVLDLHHKLGSLCVSQGNMREASKFYQKALENAKLWMSQEPSSATWQLAVVTAQGKLVEIKVAQDKLDEAALAFRESNRLTQRIASSTSATAGRDELKESYHTLGELAKEQGKNEEALQAFLEAHRIILAEAQKYPENFIRQRAVSHSHEKLGGILQAQEKREDSAKAYRDYLEMARKLALHDPANFHVQRDVCVALIKLGGLHQDRADWSAAESCYAEALQLARKFAAQDSTNFVSQRDVLAALRCVAENALNQKQPREAASLLKECLDTANHLTTRDPSNLHWQQDSFYTLHQSAQVCDELGQQAEALGYLEKAMAISDKLHATDPTNANWREYAQTTRKMVEKARQGQRSRKGGQAI